MDKKEVVKELSAKKKILTLGVILAAITVIILIVILFESRSGYFKIKNKSSYNMEYVTARFIYDDIDEQQSFDKIELGAVSSKASIRKKLDKYDLFALNAILEIRFKLEGMDEVMIDVGNFNEVFKGDIKLTFVDDEAGVIGIKVKASNRGFGSSFTDCNEEFYFDMEKGYVVE